MLGDSLQLGDGLVGLANAHGLLGGGQADLVHQLTDARDRGHDFGNGFARFCHLARTVGHLRCRGTNQRANLFGSAGTALGQRPHLAGHHGKTPALFTRTRSLHGGIERQQVGLERNALNHRNDLADLA